MQGDTAFLYFECFDIGDYDTAPVLASVLFAGGTVRRQGDGWVFSEITGGSASPISIDHYYFP